MLTKGLTFLVLLLLLLLCTSPVLAQVDVASSTLNVLITRHRNHTGERGSSEATIALPAYLPSTSACKYPSKSDH